MKHLKRKLTAAILSVLLATSSFTVAPINVIAATTEAAEADEGIGANETAEVGAAESNSVGEIIASGITGDCTWVLDEEGTLTISGNGSMKDYNEYPYYPEWGTKIKSVIIRKGVTAIGVSAFSDCTDLTSVTIPDSVTTISPNAFYNCTSLINITIPDSVTNIGSNAFDNTAWYDNQPDGMVYAGKVVYEYKGEEKYSVTTISIQDGTKGIAGSAFKWCTALKSINIPNSVTNIGDRAFASCKKLTSVTIPNSVTNIDGYAFEWCESLTSITIPNSVTTIHGFAFTDCRELKRVTIPSTVNSIGICAFGYVYTGPGGYGKIEDFVIAGSKSSEAQRYARENDFKFVEIHSGEHSYGEPVWTWDGYSAATAKFTCVHNDDIQNIDATVSSKVTKEPACAETGIRTCTAKVTFNGKTYTDTKEKTIPAIGHSYSEPTWIWNGYSVAKATFTCSKDNDAQVIDTTVTTKITKEPTCTKSGIRTCTAKVTFNGKTYTDTKEKTVSATGHRYSEPTWTWTGYSAAEAIFTCAGGDDTQIMVATVTTKVTKEPTCTKSGIRTCTAKVTFNGKTYTDTKEKTVPATGHSYGEPTWTWSGYSLAKATFICSEDDDTQVKNAKVTTKITKKPTATETGIRTCTATVTLNGETYTDTKLKVIPATGIIIEAPGSGEDYYGYDVIPGAAPSFVMGDTNEDNVMDIRDVTAIQYHLAGIKRLSRTGVISADIDEDEQVTINDATKIQLYLAYL